MANAPPKRSGTRSHSIPDLQPRGPGWRPRGPSLQKALGGTAAEVVQRFTLALSAAEKAIALAPGLPTVMWRGPSCRAEMKWDWAGAAADLERALALNPSAAHALRMYSYAVAGAARPDA